VKADFPEPEWLDDVEEKDYAAAHAYLSLKLDEAQAVSIVTALLHAPLSTRRANDVLRACGYLPLHPDDTGVRHEHAKVAMGKRLSPILVVSFTVGGDIADGFHRLSYAYHANPYAGIPMRVVDWQPRR
jgi:hypothetical protein